MDIKQLKNKSVNIRQGIVKEINEFNKLKKERVAVNVLVKDYKSKRDELVKRMKSVINDLKGLEKLKGEINKDDINMLKKLINKKEWFFQVNALSIKKEEALMKELKDLNKRLKEAKMKTHAVNKIKNLVKELGATRRRHNEFHKIVIEKADESNNISQQMKVVQKRIKSLKKEGKIVRSKLKEELAKFKKVKQDRQKKALKVKEEEAVLIKKKQEEALTKLKEKKKLTTDDLLAFQK